MQDGLNPIEERSAEINKDILVQFKNVSKTYDGDVLAVRNLDLDIRKGEFLTLLGPSGSGKTTTLMMLAGFETPSDGSIWLSGDRIDTLPPPSQGYRRRIPAICPVSAHDRRGEHRVPLGMPQSTQERNP